MMGTMMQDLAFAIPGVDEAMSFAEIMKCVRRLLIHPSANAGGAFCNQSCGVKTENYAPTHRHVKSMEYSVIVFDTAPTGHTLRFLSFPSVLEKALGKLSTLSGRIGPMLNQVEIRSSLPLRRRQLCSPFFRLLFFFSFFFFHVDVYAYGRSSGRDRGHVLEARIDACGNYRGQHAV